MNALITEYRPAAPLRAFVQSYWAGAFNIRAESQFVQSVIPNGFIELIIHLTNDHCYLTKNGQHWAHSPDFTLIGLFKKPYEVRFSRKVEVFGIRFYPEGIVNIFGVPPAQFMATYEDSTDVFGRVFQNYCARLRETGPLDKKLSFTNDFLLEQLLEHKKDFDYVRRAAEIIRQKDGLLSQEYLTDRIYISLRQLQRAFKQQIGMTAKQYMRLARLNAVQRYLQGHQQVNFSEAAYRHGFADQSHFIREFKSFTGYSPGSFLEDRERFIVNPDGEE